MLVYIYKQHKVQKASNKNLYLLLNFGTNNSRSLCRNHQHALFFMQYQDRFQTEALKKDENFALGC